jgi:hypothetical protein
VGQTILLAFLLLLPIAGLAEALFRSEAIQELLAGPDAQQQTVQPLDKLRWERLEQLVEEQGNIDCIFLGSTRLSYTVKPDLFEKAFEAQTGQPIHCFNYGGLVGTATVAQESNLILDRYQPDFLIISTESFAIDDQLQDQAAARLGVQLSADPGPAAKWLDQHSAAYRYYTFLGSAPAQAASSPTTEENWRLAQGMSPDGFIPYGTGSSGPIQPPSQKSINAYRRFTPPHVSPEKLIQVMELQTRVPVLLLELPIHPTVMDFFEDGVDTYRKVWVEPVEQVAARRGIPFWQTHAQDIIPEEGWASRSRLTPQGAEIFSRWLGEQVGQAAAGGSLQISPDSDRTTQP